MIPKIIHYIWLGNNQLNELSQKCIESWKKTNPDFDIKKWDEKNFDFSLNLYANEALTSKKYAFASDYARLKIIYENGGFYFDTDVELLKSLSPLLTEKCVLGFESKTQINVGNIIGAEPHNPVIKKMLEEYENLNFIKPDRSFNTVPSPFYNTKALISLGLKSDGSFQNINGASVYPVEYFCPKDLETGILKVTGNTYSIHHFDGSWLDENSICMNKIKQILMRKIGKGFLYRLVVFFFQNVVLRFRHRIKVLTRGSKE